MVSGKLGARGREEGRGEGTGVGGGEFRTSNLRDAFRVRTYHVEGTYVRRGTPLPLNYDVCTSDSRLYADTSAGRFYLVYAFPP